MGGADSDHMEDIQGPESAGSHGRASCPKHIVGNSPLNGI